ncbi:hypothetical protein BH23GEM6_BH23GEM6_01180 [soil metagenome]
MHVYLRDEPIELRMLEVDSEGLVPDGSDLTAIAFFVLGNEAPSFRALLPSDTIEVLREALLEPVTLGVLAEEPESPDKEIQAMVGLAVPVSELDVDPEPGEEPEEPWKASAGDPEAWRGDSPGEAGEQGMPRTALLAFAPLVRLHRKFPLDFGDELADLLEAALSGVTRPALEARVDRMLGDL